MLCLWQENRFDCDKIMEVGYTDSKPRHSNPDVTVFEYGEDYVLVAATEDYRRSIPCFANLRDAIETACHAIQYNKLEESYLSEVVTIPNGRVIVFDNWASFVVSEELYQEMRKSIDEKDLSYSSAIAFMYHNCA